MYRIFLSSPNDVSTERDRAQAVIERLNTERPGAPIFSLTRWEESFYTATATFQDQIASPGEHDLVIFIFWKRLGTELPERYKRADGTSRTGTEYEFEEARDARELRTDNLPDLLVYRKTAKVLFSEDTLETERAQKKALDQFWERWFRTDTGHLIAGFQSFMAPGDFDRKLERNLRDWLRRRRVGPLTWDIEHQGSPYRGLVPYEERHSGLFFGRDNDIARARARFIEASIGPDSGRRGTPFFLILGASGSGKSSFMRAGLIPRMRAAGIPAFLEDGSDAIHFFRTLTLIPRELGDDLCSGLAAALYEDRPAADESHVGLPQLAEGDYAHAEEFAVLARSSPDSAIAPVLRALSRAAGALSVGDIDEGSLRRVGLLLGIDQLEELFARPDEDRRRLVRLLSALVTTGRVWVVATMRNDFYDRLRLDEELSALTDRGRVYDLMPPDLADYRDIIRRPAQAAGLRFEVLEHRDLAAEIEAEAGSEGALPMVAFLLEQLFRERRGDLFTFETYDRLGGAAGALAEHGDQVLGSLPEAVQQCFPRVVRRMVRKSLKDLAATASSAPLSAFAAGSSERQLIAALAEGRLVRTFTITESGQPKSSSWVRWSHEALITRWPRLRNCVEADRRDYETLDRIQGAHAVWLSASLSERPSRLLAGLALVEATDLLQRWPNDVEESLRAFVEASEAHAHENRRRRRRIVSMTVISLTVFLIIAIAAGMVAWKQRNLAIRERVATDRTARFLVSLFKIADPNENRGNSITVREMLDRGAAQVGQGLEAEPAIRADLRTAMGEAYAGLGLYDDAKKLLNEAEREQKGNNAPYDSQIRTLLALGSTLYLSAAYADAEKVLARAVEIARAHLPAGSELCSEALDDLADVYAQQEKYGEAEQLAHEALNADRRRGPERASVLAHTLDTLGSIYFYGGDLISAEKTMREALELHKASSGMRHAATAQAMANLAAVFYLGGRYGENLALLQQALPIYRAVYGAEHPEVASLLIDMGRSALMMGRVDEAEPLLRNALALAEKLKGATHDELVSPLNSLAMIDAYHGKLSDAASEIERAEQIARLPAHGMILDQVLLNVADVQFQLGNFDRSTTSLTESHRLLEAAFPLDKHPAEAWRYAVWDTVHAELLAHEGKDLAARKAIEDASPVIAKRFGAVGFYSLLVERRSKSVEDELKRKSQGK